MILFSVKLVNYCIFLATSISLNNCCAEFCYKENSLEILQIFAVSFKLCSEENLHWGTKNCKHWHADFGGAKIRR